MTLNIWGLSGNWERRCQLIVKLLRHEQPDIVGLQEVCHLQGSSLIGESQAVVLARMAGYPFWHFVPAHRSETKTIGQAVLSHYPITAVDILPFPRDPTDPKDAEDRVAVWVRVALGRGIEFCVTHLSLSRKARERSVRQLVSWLWRISNAPKILVGDLNDEPNSPPLQFLLREANPPFADAWQIVNGSEGGFTFPSHAPKHRIDYVLFSPPNAFEVEEVRTVGDVPDSCGVYPSDHLGLVAVFKLSEGRATALPKNRLTFSKP
ncbi:Metal-dependent hydrolase, endonuclease/exonuclease/phosphatase family [Candidatus Fervidibacteria bacterium JGI MDM2 JNZ-1-D12]